jgi:hypothetical protein
METACAAHRSKLRTEPYATIVPDRRPPVKCHSGIGLAKLAVGDATWGRTVRGGEIYERTADGWELLYRVEAGTLASQLPWRAEQ